MNQPTDHARTIFLHAVENLPPEQWEAYLDVACGGDAALRAHVRDLLQAHRELGSFRDDAPAYARTLSERPLTEAVGTVIGPYKLLEQIGEGGFGVVFMAEQTAPVERKVALKVIKPGMDTRQVIARFEAERQALALMDHPNIAKVLEAGATTGGRPFFVMELVKGFPITEFCDRHRLSPRRRLELFLDVCCAVQHAHQKGIIHRDLKPSNVLVAEYDEHAVPKIIDFGVAKATGGKLTERTMFTQYGQLIGTLAYMSPEQAKLNQLDIDTRSDVYSLGVLLYELLTGTTPFGEQRLRTAAFDEMLRILRDEEPPPPSTRLTTIDNLSFVAANRHTEAARLGYVVRGELDWIVMKCLEKDRARRYATATDLSRDIQRYLGDEPVEACPPTAAYRFRKFAGRHRGALSIAATAILGVILVVSALVASNIAITRQTAQKEQALRDKDAALIAARVSEQDANTKAALARAAQSEAQENLADARAAVDQMLMRVADRLSLAPHMEHVHRELLEDALTFYEKFLVKDGHDPVLREETAWAYRRMALIQRSLGQLVESEQSYRRHFALFAELESQSPLEPSTRASLARAHLQFAGLRAELGNREEQEEHCHRAVRIAEELVQEFPEDQYYRDQLVYANIHVITQIRRPPEEEEGLLRRNLALTQNPHLVGNIYSMLGNLEHREGRYAEAERDSLKSFETYESIAAQAEMGGALLQMADAVAADGRQEQAEGLYRRASIIVDKLATDQPGFYYYRNNQALLHFRHANLLKKLDQTADAEHAYRRAAELYVRLAADFPAFPAYRQTAFDQRLGLGQFLVEAGRPQDAQQVYGEALALAEQLTADFPTRLKHWQGLIRSHIELGRLLEQSGKTAESEEVFREAVAISEKLEAKHGGDPDCRREVARCHLDTAWQFRIDVRRAEAEKLYLWALEHFTRLLDASPQSQQAREDLAYARFILADHYRWTPGRLGAAEKLFQDALGQYADLSADFLDVPGYQVLTADSRERLASVWQFQGRLREAEQALKEVLPVAERLAAAHPDDGGVRMILAMATRRWGETVRHKAPPQDVEQAFRRSEAMHEKLAADFPLEKWHRFEWGVTCQMLVPLLARDLEQPQAAEGFYRRAVTVFEGLATEFPRDLLFRTRLADAHREWACCLRDIGRTPEATEILDLAVTHYSQAVEQGTGDIWGVWYPLALVHLSAGRSGEYRVLCEALLARFGQADAPDFWVVAVCKLAPDSVADLSQPVHIAEKMLDRDPDNADLAGVLGETLYRQGDLEAAVHRLEACRAAPGVGVAWRKLFLAMAYHRLGRTVEAQQLLTEATQWMDKNAREKLADGAELEQPLQWCQRTDLQLLHHEAQELLSNKD